jgi:hypothetical protein
MSNFNYEIINNEAIITKYSGSSNLIYIPDEINGFRITGIGEGVFKNHSYITSVRLPANLKSIGKEAFEDCKKLTKIKFPDSVELLGECAFHNCDSLKKVKFTNPNLRLSSQVFRMCFHLKSVEFPEGLREIPYQTFKGCDSLEEITIPSTVESIGDWAFEFCMNLKNVFMLGRNIQIERSVFHFVAEVTVHCYKYSKTFRECLRINQPTKVNFKFYDDLIDKFD